MCAIGPEPEHVEGCRALFVFRSVFSEFEDLGDFGLGKLSDLWVVRQTGFGAPGTDRNGEQDESYSKHFCETQFVTPA